jgi:hypothetical protein
VVRGIDTDTCSRLLYSKRLRDRSRIEDEEEEEGAWRVPRSLELMSRSVALVVIPHSATSRASGDDTSTIVSWNSGV